MTTHITSSDGTPVAVSGSLTRTGYSFNTIAISDLNPEHLKAVLMVKIAPNPEFYDNTPVVLDISAIEDLSKIDYKALQNVCESYNLYLLGLSGIDNEDKASFLNQKKIPIVNSNRYARVREENFKPKVIVKSYEVQVPIKVPYKVEVKVPEPILTIYRNIRSGESISARDNSVVIFGNVANSARIIASHNVIIFGSLYGEVYAGSPKDSNSLGNPHSYIYTAGVFQPTLCAICGNYQTADDMEHDPKTATIYGKRQELYIHLSADAKNLMYMNMNEILNSNSKF